MDMIKNNDYGKKYYVANKAKLDEYKKAYYEKNKQRILNNNKKAINIKWLDTEN